MPLRCLDSRTGQSVQSFDLSDAHWNDLQAANRSERFLRMTCCAAHVTLRRSSLGTKFFAHWRKGPCRTAPESEHHLRLKEIAVGVARSLGWDANAEVAGQTPSGEHWTADVLASRGAAQVAIEIQWSSQTQAETMRRQDRYEESGVRGLWLMRRPSVSNSKSLPVAKLEISETGYTAALPSGQKFKVAEFLVAAFERRLRFGLPSRALARISVEGAGAFCWKCGARTNIITNFVVSAGPYECEFSVPDTGDTWELFSPVYARLPEDPERGVIKERFSRTQGRSYLSNGCVHCDALFGQFESLDIDGDPKIIFASEFVLDEDWVELMGSEELPMWGVFEFPE